MSGVSKVTSQARERLFDESFCIEREVQAFSRRLRDSLPTSSWLPELELEEPHTADQHESSWENDPIEELRMLFSSI